MFSKFNFQKNNYGTLQKELNEIHKRIDCLILNHNIWEDKEKGEIQQINENLELLQKKLVKKENYIELQFIQYLNRLESQWKLKEIELLEKYEYYFTLFHKKCKKIKKKLKKKQKKLLNEKKKWNEIKLLEKA